MNIEINGVNLIITPEIKDMVEKKLSRKLDQLLINFDKDQKIAFLHLEKDKYEHFKAKFDMALPGKDGHLIAECKNVKLIPVITGIREQLEKQIKKYKQDKVNYSLG